MTRKHRKKQTHVRLIVCPRPLSIRDRVETLVPTGVTVAEHLRAIGCELDRLSALVFINGFLIPRAEWELAVPQAGQVLVLHAVPAGGDDGQGKSILGISALLGLFAFQFFAQQGGTLSKIGQNFGLGPWMIGGAIEGGNSAKMMLAGGLAGGVFLGGVLAFNALIPLPSTPNARTHG